MIDRESKSVKRKRCHNVTAFVIAPKVIVLNSKSALCSHKPYINCLIYETDRDYNRERKRERKKNFYSKIMLTDTH
jgi:hypothetical protein